MTDILHAPRIAAEPPSGSPLRPLVTMIVPVKDEEEAIAGFVSRVTLVLDSLNEPRGWEILFVDDGSSDATLPAIMAANHADPRIRAL